MLGAPAGERLEQLPLAAGQAVARRRQLLEQARRAPRRGTGGRACSAAAYGLDDAWIGRAEGVPGRDRRRERLVQRPAPHAARATRARPRSARRARRSPDGPRSRSMQIRRSVSGRRVRRGGERERLEELELVVEVVLEPEDDLAARARARRAPRASRDVELGQDRRLVGSPDASRGTAPAPGGRSSSVPAGTGPSWRASRQAIDLAAERRLPQRAGGGVAVRDVQ